MAQTVKNMRQFIFDATSWRQDSKGVFIADFESTRSLLIEAQDLGSCHPALPTLVHALIERNKKSRMRDFVNGVFVYETVRILCDGPMRFRDVGGVEYTVCDLSTLDFDTGDDITAGIAGTSVTVEYVDYQGEQYPMVVNDDWCATVVYKSELERNYPGWENKWMLAGTLDLSIKERQTLVFPTVNYRGPCKASLENVIFPG